MPARSLAPTHETPPPCILTCADDTQGSIGFVLNRASPLRLSEVTVSGGKGDIAAVTDVFGGQRLRVGGPVHMDTLTVLHGYAGCQGAQKVSEVRAVALGLPAWRWRQHRARFDTRRVLCASVASCQFFLPVLRASSSHPLLIIPATRLPLARVYTLAAFWRPLTWSAAAWPAPPTSGCCSAWPAGRRSSCLRRSRRACGTASPPARASSWRQRVRGQARAAQGPCRADMRAPGSRLLLPGLATAPRPAWGLWDTGNPRARAAHCSICSHRKHPSLAAQVRARRCAGRSSGS